MVSTDMLKAVSGPTARNALGSTFWAIGVPLLVGFVFMYVPTYVGLWETVWASAEQGHGPIILVISFWLAWRRRERLAELPDNQSGIFAGAALLGVGLLLYIFGRTQQLDSFEVLSQILVLAGVVHLMKGTGGLKALAFPLLFMLFMVPLPSMLVQVVTTPLKAAVSYVAESSMHMAGYPIARSGVILSVGPYQLLVADACAGLNSMFTLEALGLLYMNLMGYTSPLRNILLASVLIPISFCANVVRVIILVLITYHFGDEAGQGFVHGFAGMVLFMVALMLMLVVDKVIGNFVPAMRAHA